MPQEINRLKKEYPGLSSLVILGRAVAGKNLTFRELTKLVRTHVDKEDYTGHHRDTIVAHLRKLSGSSRKLAYLQRA